MRNDNRFALKLTNQLIWIISMLIAQAVLVTARGCQPQFNPPDARYGARMIFDPVEHRAILFGGRAYGLFGLKYFDDLWRFNNSSQTWTPIKISHRPAARLSPGMVYDQAHHKIILFGGHTSQGRLGDTWIYNIAENFWEDVTPKNSPPPRSDTGMVYDKANQVVILFGGYCQENNRDLCDDTWTFDPETNMWTEMKPSNSPPVMYGHTLVYDPINQLSLLWGGHMSAIKNGVSSSIGYNDTLWRYSCPENSWEEIASKSVENPSPRYWHASVFDSESGKLLLFGGDGGNGFLADTWLFDMSQNTWERVITNDMPSPRTVAAIVYDNANGGIFLFGGLGENQTTPQDTWIFETTDTQSAWTLTLPTQGR